MIDIGWISNESGYLELEIEDRAGTNIVCNWNRRDKALEITLDGSSELDSIIDAFYFVANTLKRERDRNHGA